MGPGSQDKTGAPRDKDHTSVIKEGCLEEGSEKVEPSPCPIVRSCPKKPEWQGSWEVVVVFVGLLSALRMDTGALVRSPGPSRVLGGGEGTHFLPAFTSLPMLP